MITREQTTTQLQPAILRTAFTVAALGRVGWGAAAVASPSANFRVAGVAGLATPEVTYLTRVFGARALAIGLGYLRGDADSRSQWQRLGLLIDTLDTISGLTALRRIEDAPRRRAAALLVAITGGYAALGAIGLAWSQLNVQPPTGLSAKRSKR